MPKENLAETAAGSFLGIDTICILLIIEAIIMRKNKIIGKYHKCIDKQWRKMYNIITIPRRE